MKLASDVVSNVVTIAAVIVGAIWAYWAFLRERTRWPKATVELVISHRELTTTDTLLHVKVKVHNAGRGLMNLTRIRVDVNQVLPLPGETVTKLGEGSLKPENEVRADWEELDDAEFLWGEGKPMGSEPEIEPGENDEFGTDFIVPSTLQTVYVYVYVANVKKGDNQLGWPVTTYYDLKGEVGAESAVNVVATEPAMSQLTKETV